MFKPNWSLRVSMRQASILLTILVASTVLVASAAAEQDSENSRIKRAPEEHSAHDGADAIEDRDKKTPRGFLGMRGKKAPSSFLGLRGRRSDSDEYPEEDLMPFRSYEDLANAVDDHYPRMGEPLRAEQQVAHPLDLIKRAPSGFLGMRGKKTPSGFLGMRGKKAPSSFLGLRGKKTPSGFLGMRGKKDDMDYDDLESVLQALRQRYTNDQEYYTEDKRTPRGFLGLRGKKSSSDYPIYDPRETDGYYDKRASYPRFLGLRG